MKKDIKVILGLLGLGAEDINTEYVDMMNAIRIKTFDLFALSLEEDKRLELGKELLTVETLKDYVDTVQKYGISEESYNKYFLQATDFIIDKYIKEFLKTKEPEERVALKAKFEVIFKEQ